MTVASEISKSGPYNGNGSTTVFDYGFRILDATHIEVVKTVDGIDATVSPSAYTVSGVGGSGGNVTFSVAPASGEKITIIRNVPFTQGTDLENQGAYFAETIEEAFDLAAMRDQQMSERIDRALAVPVGQSGFDPEGAVEKIIYLDKLYLGARSSAPALDNDGNALTSGATYWDAVSSQMFVWSGNDWLPSLLAGKAVRSLTVATEGQTAVTVPTYVPAWNAISVFLNGLKVMLSADYAETDQNTITFSTGLTAGDEVEAVVLQPCAVEEISADALEQILEALEDAQAASAAAAASAAEAAATFTARMGEDIHDRILSYLLRTSEGDYRRLEYNGSRRSIRDYQLPTFGSDVGFDDEGEGYSASLNSTAIGKSLQYLSRLSTAHPSRRATLVPFVEKFAELLIGLQWNVPNMAIHGGIKLAPSDGSASVFGTSMAGLGLIEAYRVTGRGRYLAAAVRAADFCVMMHDPNDRYDDLYGETPIPARTVGSITFNGFCDRVTAADDITITSTTWNVVACEFLKEVYDETGTAGYQTVSNAALAFYQYPVLNFYDVFLIENDAPSAHVNAFWNLSSRLNVADHSFRRLGGLSITSGSLATSGTVAAVAGTAVTLAASASATDGAYIGMVLDTNGGAGSGQGRMITAYNGTTKVATIEKAFTDIIDATTTYRIGWGVNTVGTDQVEYGLSTLFRMGVSVATLKAAYDQIASWPNTDTGDFGAAFDPGICFAGYFRVDSGLYSGAGRHFGTYYDSQGVGTMLALKHAIALADYTASLAMAEVMPDRAALVDENFDTIYNDGWATKGTIPLAVLGLGILEVAGH